MLRTKKAISEAVGAVGGYCATTAKERIRHISPIVSESWLECLGGVRTTLTMLEVAEWARVHPIVAIQAVCGSIPESQKAQFQEPADKLAHHLMPPKDLVFLTHYFVSHWLPRLGPGQGWFVALMRGRGYINQRTGEVRDEILLPEGYAKAARWWV